MRKPLVIFLLILLLVVTACSSDSGHSSNFPTGQQLPSAPSNLSGTALGWDSLFLEWSDAANEDGYRIYRDGSLISDVSANAVTFSDTGLKGGTTYQYTVRAYNDAGESNPCSCVVKTANPPINVTLNYVGTKSAHDWETFGQIRLVVLVTDGTGAETPYMMPPGSFYALSDRDVTEVNERVFHRAAVGEYLRISVMAYEDDDNTLFDLVTAALPILAPYIGVAGTASSILSAYKEATGKPLFENTDDYVGYYEGFWSASESWGVGQHSWVGKDDLRLWFSISSDDGNLPRRPQNPSSIPLSSIMGGM